MNFKDLLLSRKNITSQYGEDGVIGLLINLMNKDLSKVCCEVGAGDGVTFSNVHSLWKHSQWTALLIEGDEVRYSKLIQETKGAVNAFPVKELIASKGEKSIFGIAAANNISLTDGLIVIDIDSFDSYVFANLPSTDLPAICIVEFNNCIPPWIDYQDPEGDVFLRHSLKTLCRIGKQKGFRLVVSTITNAFFVRDDLAQKYDLDSTTPEEAYLYEEQFLNRSAWGAIIPSQMITSYPIFLHSPNKLDSIYFKLRGLLRAITGKEPYLKPSQNVKNQLSKAGLFY
jgi:hypothetical protein